MQKRLRNAMPRISLFEHSQKAASRDGGNESNIQQENAAATVTNVEVMARRIGEAERKKRRVYTPSPERPLGGDVENEESEDATEQTDDDERHLI